ncbi:D-sedoheptulose-7-phosphate isomerase [Gayadomonas joobiniege]|uniref:D-sedoheptulose-7-phosphate isomerase n=1 Tax=Gayadomonas joobiniege TaxID=1234606 RepID=UPI0003829D54|nr:SIS domain-containing protein [Gayadomonas joobiniege]
MQELIKQSFTESIHTKIAALDVLAPVIENAATVILNALLAERKVLCCGDGFSHSAANVLANALNYKLEHERPSLPALALNPDAISSSLLCEGAQSDHLFALPLKAIAQPGDVLVCIAGMGHSASMLRTIEAGLSKDMLVVALTGGDGGEVAGLLGPNDVDIRIPSESALRTLEVHQLVVHSIVDAIEKTLFPGM